MQLQHELSLARVAVTARDSALAAATERAAALEAESRSLRGQVRSFLPSLLPPPLPPSLAPSLSLRLSLAPIHLSPPSPLSQIHAAEMQMDSMARALAQRERALESQAADRRELAEQVRGICLGGYAIKGPRLLLLSLSLSDAAAAAPALSPPPPSSSLLPPPPSTSLHLHRLHLPPLSLALAPAAGRRRPHLPAAGARAR